MTNLVTSIHEYVCIIVITEVLPLLSYTTIAFMLYNKAQCPEYKSVKCDFQISYYLDVTTLLNYICLSLNILLFLTEKEYLQKPVLQLVLLYKTIPFIVPVHSQYIHLDIVYVWFYLITLLLYLNTSRETITLRTQF